MCLPFHLQQLIEIKHMVEDIEAEGTTSLVVTDESCRQLDPPPR
jgi:hypothetical protein